MEFTVVVNSRRHAQGTNTDHSPPYNLWKTGAHLRSFHSITAVMESRDFYHGCSMNVLQIMLLRMRVK